MHSQLARVVHLAATVTAIAACSGGSTSADAQISPIGQLCTRATSSTCPSAAPNCLLFPTSTTGYCSTLCLTGATMMTDARGQLISVVPDPNAAAQTKICTDAYTEAAGSAACEALVGQTPPDDPLLGDRTYTEAQFACVIRCGANNVCPGTLICATEIGWCVPPP